MFAIVQTPATLISPHPPLAGVRKAPRHEIASGDSGPAVPQEGGAAKKATENLVLSLRLGQFASAIHLDWEHNLNVTA
jgi:hypothetical protein